MNRKGFSLIEVLITLAVIGIVSALVLPGIHNNTSRKSYATQLDGVHQALSHAINQILIDERQLSLADTTLSESAGDFLKKYIQIQKDCGTDAHSNCLASTYKSLDGSSKKSGSQIFGSGLYCVKTIPGAVICMNEMSADNNGYHGHSQVIIDINGKKAPNTNGRDLFQFEIYSDGQISNGYNISPYAASGEKCRDAADTAGYGGSCFQKVVADGWNMDY